MPRTIGRKKRAIGDNRKTTLYEMPEAGRNAKRRDLARFIRSLRHSAAQPVRFGRAKPQQTPGLVLAVDTMRTACFERHQLEIERTRLVNRRHTAAGQRVQAIQRVVRRLAKANLVRASHDVTPNVNRLRRQFAALFTSKPSEHVGGSRQVLG